MAGKPKINVTQVWILQRGTMWDTPTILNVHLDPQEVMNAHMDLGGWSYDEKEGYWSTEGDNEYYLLTQHPILVTRKTKTPPEHETREALIKEVAEAMKERYPEVQDALARRGEHLAEVAVETIEKHNNNRP